MYICVFQAIGQICSAEKTSVPPGCWERCSKGAGGDVYELRKNLSGTVRERVWKCKDDNRRVGGRELQAERWSSVPARGEPESGKPLEEAESSSAGLWGEAEEQHPGKEGSRKRVHGDKWEVVCRAGGTTKPDRSERWASGSLHQIILDLNYMDCRFVSYSDFEEENVDTYVVSLSFQDPVLITDKERKKLKKEEKEKKKQEMKEQLESEKKEKKEKKELKKREKKEKEEGEGTQRRMFPFCLFRRWWSSSSSTVPSSCPPPSSHLYYITEEEREEGEGGERRTE